MTASMPTRVPPIRAARALPEPGLCRLVLMQAMLDGTWAEARIEQLLDRIGAKA